MLSPSIDYKSDDKCIENLRSRFAEGNVDVVMGSSMGGFVGFYLSIAFNKPTLLFNPALFARSVFQNAPDYNNPDHSFKRLVLGARDEVVDPKTTLKFVAERIRDNTDYQINLRQDVGHRIPSGIFEEEVRSFFDHLLMLS